MREHDPVKFPDHYRWIPGIECKQVVQHFDFFRGCAIKYLWRSGRKAGVSEEQDLKKAVECILDRLAYLDSLKPSQEPPPPTS